MIGTRLGPYEVTAKLGEGGMGVVYRARDFHLGREVALKVLPEGLTSDPERTARFEREAKLLAQLNHPNIAQIHGLEVQGETRALVMELVEGPTLADRLEKGSLPLDEGLSIARQIAEALEEAHEKGIIHRDLKPQNVKASTEGRVKVLDFGLAKAMDPAGASGVASASQLAASPTLTLGATVQGVILGTAAYMSPEQAKGLAVDKRADIWAFGVVLYEMLAGGSLFAGDSVGDTLAAVIRAEIDLGKLPSETPSAIRQLLRRCLERNPRNRLHDIADARIVLAEVLAGRPDEGGPSAAAASPVAVVPAWKRSLPWTVALLGVGLAAFTLVTSRPAASPRALQLPTSRFTVAPPAGGELESYPALSPDGRLLAFSFVPDRGIARLWLHSFDSGKSREMPGTEHATDPFWSPDGRQLAFFAAGELRRVEIGSGLVQSVARVSDPRGGTWSESGEILFSPTSSAAIARVAAGGGGIRPLTELAPGEQSHRFPWALPGGDAVLFYTLTGKASGIHWLSTRTGERKRLLPDPSRAAYDPRGYVLWQRQGSLVAQRFDPERAELSGEVSVVADQVGGDTQKSGQVWLAVASGTVAVRVGALRQSRLRWFDRRGVALDEVTAAGNFSEPALSADGARVVVMDSASPERISPDAWIYDTTGKGRGVRLTFEGDRQTPTWSADGRSVFYATDTSDGHAIVRKRADGSGAEEEVFRSRAALWADAESPREPLLVLEGGDAESGYRLWFLPLDGERRLQPFQQSSAGSQSKASFSPDGKLLAYTSDESGLSQIYVQPVAGSGVRWQVTSDGGDLALWRADGKELFYVGLDRVLRAVPVRSLAPFAAGPPEELFLLRIPQPAPTGYRTYYAPSPDGQRFLVNDHLRAESEPGIQVVLGWQPPTRGGGGSAP